MMWQLLQYLYQWDLDIPRNYYYYCYYIEWTRERNYLGLKVNFCQWLSNPLCKRFPYKNILKIHIVSIKEILAKRTKYRIKTVADNLDKVDCQTQQKRIAQKWMQRQISVSSQHSHNKCVYAQTNHVYLLSRSISWVVLLIGDFWELQARACVKVIQLIMQFQTSHRTISKNRILFQTIKMTESFKDQLLYV